MAETGTSAPSYRLSQGTQSRVAKAGLGGDARKHLQNAAMADEAGNIVTGIKDQIVEKQEDTTAREDAWDTGFDAMGDRGSWASGELYDQFQIMEAGYRDEYLEAVRTGDTKLQKRLLKDQGSRSSSLQEWKGTMETALKIHTEYGWGEVIKGDTPDANRKRKILLAMSKMDSSTKVKIGSDGEMVFNIPGVGDVTRREVDEMVAAGAAPVVREEAFMASSLKAKDLGETGKSFDKNTNHYTHKKAYAKELRANPDAATSILNDIYSGSETSLAEDLKSGIIAEGVGIEFKVKLPDGVFPDDKDRYLTEQDLVDGDIDAIIAALKVNPKILAEVAADWQTQIEENIYNTAKGEYDAAQASAAEAAYIKSLNADSQKAYLADKEAKAQAQAEADAADAAAAATVNQVIP